MKDIRAGIIGCGKAGHMHAIALKNIKTCSFVAAQSRSLKKAEEFAGQYGIKGYDSIAKMVAKEKIDIAVVCTTHPTHRVAIEAIEAGAHVLIEKPLASSLEDCDAIIAAGKKYKRKVGVIGQRRLLPASLRAKKAIENGKIGKPVLGTATMLGWRSEEYYKSDPWRGTWAEEGGGVLVNQAPHQLDLLSWLMDDEIEELYGVWGNLNHPYIEVEDTALAIIKYKSGALGNLLLSNSQKPGIHCNVHIHGELGASVGVETDKGAMFIAGMSKMENPPTNDIWTIPGEEKLSEQWRKEDIAFFDTIDPIEYYIRLQNEDFIDAVKNDRAPLIPGEEGRITVEIFTAIYRSAKTNQPVRWPL